MIVIRSCLLNYDYYEYSFNFCRLIRKYKSLLYITVSTLGLQINTFLDMLGAIELSFNIFDSLSVISVKCSRLTSVPRLIFARSDL